MTNQHKPQSESSLRFAAIADIVTSDEFDKRCDPDTLGSGEDRRKFLTNRLSLTLDEGFEAGRRLERELMRQRLAELLGLDR
ncbi:hypothetical protein [Kordiimonas sp.]|uniref:hypothetical protein n=1 Tax=Kordiimonas sp. TaxID=1970157 RepID=UPI003A90CBDB